MVNIEKLLLAPVREENKWDRKNEKKFGEEKEYQESSDCKKSAELERRANC